MPRTRCRTRNTEYELSGSRCIAVRDLRTGQLLAEHRALGQTVRGYVRLTPEGVGAATGGPAQRGVCLWFRAADRDLVTTPIEDLLY